MTPVHKIKVTSDPASISLRQIKPKYLRSLIKLIYIFIFVLIYILNPHNIVIKSTLNYIQIINTIINN